MNITDKFKWRTKLETITDVQLLHKSPSKSLWINYEMSEASLLSAIQSSVRSAEAQRRIYDEELRRRHAAYIESTIRRLRNGI